MRRSSSATGAGAAWANDVGESRSRAPLGPVKSEVKRSVHLDGLSLMHRPRLHFTARRIGIALTIILGAVPALAFVLFVVIARGMAARSECENHIRQIGLMLQNYATSKERFPPGVIPDLGLPPEKRWSWIAAGLPYLEANAPYFPDPSKPWDDEVNRCLLANYYDHQKQAHGVDRIERDDWDVFLCPHAPRRTDSGGHGLTSYVGSAGVGRDAPWLRVEDPKAGLFGYREGTRPE